MKIAALGDIHGNIEALKAAYGAAAGEGVDKIYHLGDLGGYAPGVDEVVDFLIERGVEGVQGNYDDAVGNGRAHCGCRYVDALQAAMAERSFEWTKAHTSQKSKEYMRGLPFELSFTADGMAIKLFHATPLKNNIYWYGDRSERFFLDMASRARADVMIYGHTHLPYRKDLGNRVFINAGSVGKPKDGDPRATVAIVEVSDDGVRAEFMKVTYDVGKTVEAISGSGLPPYFAERLKEGL